MTRKTKLITLGCVLVAAIGVTVGVGLSESKKEAISESGEVVFELPADDATALSWQYDDDGSEVLLAFHKDGDWLYDEDEAFPVDGEKIDALLDVFSELSAASLLRTSRTMTSTGWRTRCALYTSLPGTRNMRF